MIFRGGPEGFRSVPEVFKQFQGSSRISWVLIVIPGALKGFWGVPEHSRRFQGCFSDFQGLQERSKVISVPLQGYHRVSRSFQWFSKGFQGHNRVFQKFSRSLRGVTGQEISGVFL